MLAVVTLSLAPGRDVDGWGALARQMKGVAWAIGLAGSRASEEARRAGVGLLDRGDVRLVDVVAPDGARGLVSLSLSLEQTPGGPQGATRMWHLSVTGLPKGPTEPPVRVSDLLARRVAEAFGDEAGGLSEGGATSGGATRHFYGVA